MTAHLKNKQINKAVD